MGVVVNCTVDHSPTDELHKSPPQPEAVDVDSHHVAPRAMSLSYKYAGLGKRSSNNNNNNDEEDDNEDGGARDIDGNFDENSEADSRGSTAISPIASNKRALPSSLRYTGLGQRRPGVSAGMRYAGLGKRLPESVEDPETETVAAADENDSENESGNLEQMAAARQHFDVAEHQRVLNRRRRFAVDMLDEDENVNDDNGEEEEADDREAFLYGIKRQLAAVAQSGRPRLGVGMRYVGVGKRRPVNLRSRVDAGLRYMGIGKRSPNY